MNMLMLILDLPDKRLSPNARVHWSTRAKANKIAKDEAMIDAVAFLRENKFEPPRWKSARVHVRAYFRDKRSRWDRDNYIASCKAQMDGLAAAGVFDNDRGVSWGEIDLSGIDRDFPRMELSILGEDPA